jgi:hypothetical protein
MKGDIQSMGKRLSTMEDIEDPEDKRAKEV